MMMGVVVVLLFVFKFVLLVVRCGGLMSKFFMRDDQNVLVRAQLGPF